jgi:hypothetical protein
MTEQTGLPVRKWYFAINEAGGSNYASRLVKAAVLSAKATTTLQPICLFHGRETALIGWLKAQGVATVAHTPSFVEYLSAGYGAELPKYIGHWLRVDIPDIEQEDELVLYTDIDVVFRSNPVFTFPRPRYFAAAAEHERTNFSYFNSGVMVMNLPGLRAVRPAFLQSIRNRMSALSYPPHDQGSFNAFFHGAWDRLPEIFNWKPYWGENGEAVIVHFHGTKPEHATAILDGRDPKPGSSWTKIVDRDRAAYRFYCTLWSQVLGSDGHQARTKKRLRPRTEHATIVSSREARRAARSARTGRVPRGAHTRPKD